MAQIVDKTNEFRQFTESFGQAFPKSLRSGGRAALLALRRARKKLSAFSFCKLFLCAYMVKEKATKIFLQFDT